MDLKTRLNAVLSSLAHSYVSPIVRLDRQAAYCILAASVFMRRSGKISGAEQHRRFKRLLAAGIRTENDLRSWMAASFSASARRSWDTCRKQADELLEAGVNVFGWSAPFSDSPPGSPSCNRFGGPCPRRCCSAKAVLTSICPCWPYSILENPGSFLLIQIG